MRLRVDADRLAEAAAPLQEATEVAGEIVSVGAGLAGELAHAGSVEVRRATEQFMDAWGRGLGALATKADTLARMLDLAAGEYAQVNAQMRRQAGRIEGMLP
jgi:hypothetical protein